MGGYTLAFLGNGLGILVCFFGLKVLASSAEKCGFDRWFGRSNDYEINKRH
jgi:hypothetical protein